MKIVNLIILLSFVSCAGIKLERNLNRGSQKVEKHSNLQYDFYIPYIKYSSTPVDLKEECNGDEWNSVYMSNNFLTGLVPFFTLGLVRPQKAELECIKRDS